MATIQEGLDARAERVHREATIVDISVRGWTYQNLQKGGVTASIVSVNALHTGEIDETMMNILALAQSVYAHPDELAIFKSPNEVRVAKESGKVGYVFHLQGMTEIQNKLYWVEMLARIGVRIMALTYNGVNQMGCGCGEANDTGLTYFGRQVVREMNRAGVVIDLSHLGFRTARETLDISTGPLILSHSSPYDLVPNGRNAPADVMTAVAERGGVMGISVYAPIMDSDDGKFPTIDTMLDHIEYAVDKIGIDHVGIGTDHSEMTDLSWEFYVLNHRDMMPKYYMEAPYRNKVGYHSIEGFRNAGDLPKISRGLVSRGYSDLDIKKIMGGNLLRVLDQVWGTKLKAEGPTR